MLNKTKDKWLAPLLRTDVAFWYLLAMGILELWLMVTDNRSFEMFQRLSILPCLLFVGAASAKENSPRTRRQLLLGFLIGAWFLLLQSQRYHANIPTLPAGLFLSVYLMAFPFAAVAKDGQKQQGLTLFGVIFLLASAMLMVYTWMLIRGTLPQEWKTFIYWDGTRLLAIWHPNILACIFMISIAFCLVFLFRTQRLWLKLLLAGLIFAQLLAAGLTNCRTSLLITCAMIGGAAFFAISTGGWKRFFLGLGAAAVILALTFCVTQKVYESNTARLTAIAAAEKQAAAEAKAKAEAEAKKAEAEKAEKEGSDAAAETTKPAKKSSQKSTKAKKVANPQGSFWTDLRTFNGRTRIWLAAVKAIRDEPEILLRGTPDIKGLVSEYYTKPVGHAHNSWLQMLMSLGLPGLLAALVFTVSGAVNAAFILLQRKFDLQKKVVAMLVLCLMVAGAMEPFLFVSSCFYHFLDFTFFLCLGYLSQWRSAEA